MDRQLQAFITVDDSITQGSNWMLFLRRWAVFLVLLTGAVFFASCAATVPDPDEFDGNGLTFEPPIQTISEYTPVSVLKDEAAAIVDDYLIGPGDLLSLEVWNREGISNPDILVGPDGVITIARIGNIDISGLTREGATEKITDALAVYYKRPEVSLVIKDYNNNKAFVLGRIENPGVIKFPGKGTLLEALSLAGGLPVLHKDITLTRCAIIRGKDLVIWVDLRELLHNGNMALNARIKNNDVIFIPEGQDELIYVMGEVSTPGAISLSSQMTYLDALMLAGGPTEEANMEKTFILRFDGQNRAVKEINLSRMLEKGELQHNVQMQDNDVLYVAQSGVSNFNYKLSQLMPFLQVLSLSTSNLERFGIMQQFRQGLWDQDGFVDGSSD